VATTLDCSYKICRIVRVDRLKKKRTIRYFQKLMRYPLDVILQGVFYSGMGIKEAINSIGVVALDQGGPSTGRVARSTQEEDDPEHRRRAKRCRASIKALPLRGKEV
jgi:hypothetical protein